MFLPANHLDALHRCPAHLHALGQPVFPELEGVHRELVLLQPNEYELRAQERSPPLPHDLVALAIDNVAVAGLQGCMCKLAGGHRTHVALEGHDVAIAVGDGNVYRVRQLGWRPLLEVARQ